ncbi:MAG: arginase [Alphaproteobacteria bacterium]|nr:arginase [Alphaproteobacteria bacterium]
MPTLIKPETTFCAVPHCADMSALAADVAVIGAPHGSPYKPGTASHAAEAPAAVRRALGWYSVGAEQFDFDVMAPVMGGARIVDCGDVPGDLSDGAGNRSRIAEAVRTTLERGAVPLVLGGDDSVPIPMLSAYEGHGPLTIVQIDAHLDWRDEVGGERFGFSSTMRRASEMPWVERMVQIGARGPGSARARELADARNWGSRVVTARDVHARGIDPSLAHVPEGASVVLTIDVDGIDPSVVPGVILPAFGGLTYQQVLDVIHGVASRATIVGLDFVEFVPARDPHNMGAQAIARLACNVIAMIGKQRGRT